MARTFYSSHGLNVELYAGRADEHVTSTGDVDFYLDLASQAGGPVLDLACGVGRVALPLARAGHETVGLDISEAMLAAAQRRSEREPAEVRSRLTLVQADMSEFDIGTRFRLIVIAFRSFQMLLTPEKEQSCLRCVRRHLFPGGLVVIDIFDPLLHLLVPGPVTSEAPLRTEHEGIHPQTGNCVTVEVLSRVNNPVDQVLEEVWRFTEYGPDGLPLNVEDEMLRLRWIYRWEMRYLLERCGFRVRAEYSDFHRAPPAYGKEQVWVAEAVD